MCLVVSGIVRRTLATRGRKRAGPTPKAWEGWSEAEGPKDNTPYDFTINHQRSTVNGQRSTVNGQRSMIPHYR